ncbi:hypothetical protein BH11BAC1_BH11BAC1_27170 [soil metagenome]
MSITEPLQNSQESNHALHILPLEITPREKEILQLIYEGFTDKEMAANLGISHHTVRKHRERLRTKFKTDNSPSMVRMAIKLKILNE